MADFHVGEIITSLNKATFAYGGKEAVFYTTILGRIGIFAPFELKSEFSFFQLLEIAMRNEYGNAFGREHMAHRSNYAPVNNIIDGDLCEMFNRLPLEKKTIVAESLNKSITEISTKLEDFRVYFAF